MRKRCQYVLCCKNGNTLKSTSKLKNRYQNPVVIFNEPGQGVYKIHMEKRI